MSISVNAVLPTNAFYFLKMVTKSQLPNFDDEEYKLKFVTVSNGNVSIEIEGEELTLPLERIAEENNVLYLKCQQNEVITSPISTIVNIEIVDGVEQIVISYYGAKVYAWGFSEIYVEDGQYVNVGDKLGMVAGKLLKAKVFYNGKQLYLKDLQELIDE